MRKVKQASTNSRSVNIYCVCIQEITYIRINSSDVSHHIEEDGDVSESQRGEGGPAMAWLLPGNYTTAWKHSAKATKTRQACPAPGAPIFR